MHRSMWLQEALADDPSPACPPLVGPHRADVCIVGGGYTGLWTALAIKRLEPGCNVAIVEADICGGGASGRNGGFCTSWWAKLPTLVDLLGEDEGLRLARASAAAVGEIEDFCREHAIDAHMRRSGWLWVATAPAQLDTWEPSVAACEQRGIDAFVRLTPEELHQRIDQPTHLGGVWEPGTATVQPALLARGLRRVALEQGVRIFEDSPIPPADETPTEETADDPAVTGEIDEAQVGVAPVDIRDLGERDELLPARSLVALVKTGEWGVEVDEIEGAVTLDVEQLLTSSAERCERVLLGQQARRAKPGA